MAKEKEVVKDWKVAQVATETANVITDGDSSLSVEEALVKIMNDIEEIKKSVL